MGVEIQESFLVAPYEETPKETIWLSNLDLIIGHWHTTTVTLYRNNGDPNFFNIELLKVALAKALVHYYPFAGRLFFDENDRPEIRCTGEGVRLIVARSMYSVDDLIPPSQKGQELVPRVESTVEPPLDLFMFQVTFLKCGGVSLGTTMHHAAADGVASVDFINTWSDIARGSAPKSLDICFHRSSLRARSPPKVLFNHANEYQLIPAKQTSTTTPERTAAIFKMTKEQISSLKKHLLNDVTKPVSSFKVLLSLVSKCICKAWELRDDEEITVYTPVDVRRRMVPALPHNFCANALIRTSIKTTAGELLSSSHKVVVDKIDEAIARVNDEHVRSVIDYAEVLDIIKYWKTHLFSPRGTKNAIYAISWQQMRIHDANFGWGKPTFMSRSHMNSDGLVYFLNNPEDDGGISILMQLETERMALFKQVFYDDLKQFSI